MPIQKTDAMRHDGEDLITSKMNVRIPAEGGIELGA
jgi:hypothetical protein